MTSTALSDDLASLSDRDLFDHAANVLGVPKRDPADSFVLHAPLELLARTALLRRASPGGRASIRSAIASLAAGYDAAGPGLEGSERDIDDARNGVVHELAAAIAAGDLDRVDAAALRTADALATADYPAALAAAVLPSLAAAAHGSIYLSLLPRSYPTSRAARVMLRGLARELARHPDWQLSWFRSAQWRRVSDEELVTNLLAPPSPGPLASNFIYPTMRLTEQSGSCAELLTCIQPGARGTSLAATSRALLRVAAWSMLQEPLTHAPYGWTHCLTMPQATLAMAPFDADALPIAATYILGFRSTLGVIALDPTWTPEGPIGGDALEAVCDGPPDLAAAAAWHAPRSERSSIWRALVDRAGAHPDAHLAKYALACLDAADNDPGCASHYLAALARLHAWWREQA